MAIHKLRSRTFAVGLVALLICLSGSLASCNMIHNRDSSTTASSPAVTPTVETNKALTQFSEVRGTVYLRAPIGRIETRSGGYSSSDYTSVTNHNFVFVNLRDETIHKLLPTNTSLIVFDVELPASAPSSMSPEVQVPEEGEQAPPVAWFLYGVVKADTNNDGSLSPDDLQTLAVSDMGGLGYTEVITGVEQLYHHTLRDNDTLLVIYRQAGQPFLARIDLPSRAVTSRTKFPALGPDVK